MNTNTLHSATQTSTLPISKDATGRETSSLTLQHPLFKDKSMPRLGMGCWAIGGPFHANGVPLGYEQVDDKESASAIAIALERGVRFFDTAAVYGAGHSERVLGDALKAHPDVFVSTKLGKVFDQNTRNVSGEDADPEHVLPAIENSLRRLQRERIDLVFLHCNSLSVELATPLFDAMDQAVEQGKLGAYGWSTDFPDRVESMASRPNFQAVQHAANVLFSAPAILPVIEQHGLISINRSPLAMGLLTGKYSQHHDTGPGSPTRHVQVASAAGDRDDVRSNNLEWMGWFRNGEAAGEHAATLSSIAECLKTGGRTLAQGSLAWLWAHSAATLPIPGFRNRSQVLDNTGALELGPLPDSVMRDIEGLLDRSADWQIRER